MPRTDELTLAELRQKAADNEVDISGLKTKEEIHQRIVQVLSDRLIERDAPDLELVTLAPPLSVYEAVLRVLEQLPPIGKDHRFDGGGTSYNFRSIEDITAALKPLLARHGVFIVPKMLERITSERTTRAQNALYVVDLHIDFVFTDSAGETFSADVWGQGSDTGDKATQKAITSAFKSLLSVLFCISDSEYDAERYEVPETAQPTRLEPPASKVRVAETRQAVERLDLVDWVKSHEWEWPWSDRVCDLITEKVRAEGVAQLEMTKAAAKGEPAPAPADEPATLEPTATTIPATCMTCGELTSAHAEGCPEAPF